MLTLSQEQSQSPVAFASSWYVGAMEQLVYVIQALSQAHDIDSITAIVREAARNLTGADGATFVLRDGDQCYYADENAIEPLWKGKRFPMSICVSGWVMNHAKSVVIEDIYNDPRIPVEAYRPTFVKSLAMVPIRQNAPIGAIGNYWASKRTPLPEEVAILQALADTTSVALENADLYGKLQQQVATLQLQQKRITEQHEKLETFTRALSHDLKEPVRTMISFSRMIQDDLVAPEKRSDYIQHIQKAADRMGMLIEAVFQYTQLDNPDEDARGPCSMQDILSGARENLAQLTMERGTSIVGENLPVVEGNPAHLTQVIQNMIANAIRHNEGKITVQIEAKDQGEQWLFSVRDNGSGIAPENLEKIFLPFKRMSHKEGHAGSGLSICTKIITSYGGKLWCESALGNGATFYFTLPKGKAIKEKAVDTQDSVAHRTLANVLLVDDLEGDIELMRLAFQRAKVECNILVANDGTSAQKILKNSLRGDKINLMLLDVNMPCMDGFELLSHIRQDEELKDTAVVMCTGSAYEEDKRRAKELGAIGYMVKPPTMDRLSSIIDHIPQLLIYCGDNSKKLVQAV